MRATSPLRLAAIYGAFMGIHAVLTTGIGAATAIKRLRSDHPET